MGIADAEDDLGPGLGEPALVQTRARVLSSSRIWMLLLTTAHCGTRPLGATPHLCFLSRW